MKGVFSVKLEEIETLIINGNYNTALAEIDKIINHREISLEEKIRCRILKAQIYLIIFPYTKAIEYAEESYAESKEIGNKFLMFDSAVIMPRAYFYSGEYEIKEEKSKLVNQILDSFDDKSSEAYLKRKTLAPLLQGDRFNTSLSKIEECVKIAEELNIDTLKVDAYLSLGSRHLWSGNLLKALKYAEKAIETSQAANYHYGMVVAISQKGIIQLHKGELNLVLKNLKKSHSLYGEDYLHPFFEACIFVDIGLTHWFKRDLNTALEYLQKSIILYEQSTVVTTRHYPWALIRAIIILIELGRSKEALEYVERLKGLYNSKSQYIFKKIYFLAQAIFLKSKSNPNDSKEAIQLLEEIADDEIAFLEFYGLIAFNLCDLYLSEITLYNNSEYYEKLRKRINLLKQKAEYGDSYILLAQSLLLQSKLELIEYNVEEGRILLEKAQVIAERNGIIYLEKVISSEYDLLLDQLSKWEEMSTYLPSLEDRFEFTHIEELLKRIIRNNALYIEPYDEKENPCFFLLMNKNGSILFSEIFQDMTLEEELLQGIFACINDTTFRESSAFYDIKRIRYQHFSIVVGFQNELIVVYTSVGPSYYAVKKLKSFISKFNSYLNKENLYPKSFTSTSSLTFAQRAELSKYIEETFV